MYIFQLKSSVDDKLWEENHEVILNSKDGLERLYELRQQDPEITAWVVIRDSDYDAVDSWDIDFSKPIEENYTNNGWFK